MRNLQFCVSGKRPIAILLHKYIEVCQRIHASVNLGNRFSPSYYYHNKLTEIWILAQTTSTWKSIQYDMTAILSSSNIITWHSYRGIPIYLTKIGFLFPKHISLSGPLINSLIIRARFQKRSDHCEKVSAHDLLIRSDSTNDPAPIGSWSWAILLATWIGVGSEISTQQLVILSVISP